MAGTSENIQAQMRKGILEYCILLILSRQASYASEIIAELKQAELIVVEGTLYPLLTRLKNSGIDYQQFARKMRSRGYTIDEIKEMFDLLRENR